MTAAPLLPEVRLEDQPSAESARAFFQRDRLMAAYALADIDAAEIEKARWWTATRGNEVVACALVVEALPFRPCFASGESEALATIFRDGIREPRIVVATPPAGRLAVESVYRFERVEKMHRMAVSVSTFRPRVTHGVTRLGPEQLDDVIDLYGHASRTYFTEARMEREIYFGVYIGRTLVSAAGTHVRSRLSNIAAVGNVLDASRVPRPRHGDVGDVGRDRGRARAAPRRRAQRPSGQRAGDRGLRPSRFPRSRTVHRRPGGASLGLGSDPGEDEMTTTTTPRHDVVDLALAEVGSRRVEWAGREMPVLAGIAKRMKKERPFEGLRIAACLHVTTETANLAVALRDAGASVALCASNPLSTQDDAAAALVKEGIAVFARKGEDRDTYFRHINAVLETKPQITMDDGADVVTLLHTERKDLLQHVKGGTEETTTGVIRLRAMATEGVLAYPIVAVNEAQTKHMFDNQYGTGQSSVDGILRATNILLAGKTVVVARVRLGRPRRRVALPRHGLDRDHRRGRSAPRARGGDGRLPGHADRGGRPARRPLHHVHRQRERRIREALPDDEGWRDPGQRRPLQ